MIFDVSLQVANRRLSQGNALADITVATDDECSYIMWHVIAGYLIIIRGELEKPHHLQWKYVTNGN